MRETALEVQAKQDLARKTFNGVSNYSSYGDNTFIQNVTNAETAIDSVRYLERIYDRSRTQFMLKNLTCSQPDIWARLRQISAEMFSKKTAFNRAKFDYMKKSIEQRIKREALLEEEDENKKALLEVEILEYECSMTEAIHLVEGCMKEIELLSNLHDDLTSKLGDVTEEEMEKAQMRLHVKRSISQSVREYREFGRIKGGNQEYLEQIGVSPTAVMKDIHAYIQLEDSSNTHDTSLLHTFLEDMAIKYSDQNRQQTEWLGFDPDPNVRLTHIP